MGKRFRMERCRRFLMLDGGKADRFTVCTVPRNRYNDFSAKKNRIFDKLLFVLTFCSKLLLIITIRSLAMQNRGNLPSSLTTSLMKMVKGLLSIP